MKMNFVLIIFIKNPQLGKVKTRLARSIGEDKALRVYKELLKYTLAMASNIDVQRQVWYSDYIDQQDAIDPELFDKAIQRGSNLGARMEEAFRQTFLLNRTEKALIIGSDCPDLTEDLIAKAFLKLDRYDLVVGPAVDGGYYLLGMKKNYHELFIDINWSSESVYPETLIRAEELQLKVFELPVLNDIDTEKDLITSHFMNRVKHD